MVRQDHIQDLIPGYALDCLDPGEKRSADIHLASCPECRAELAAYQQVIAELSLAAPEVEPPANLKGQILAKAGRQKNNKPATSGWLERLSRPIQQALASLSRSPGLALASLALVMLLVGGNLALFGQINRQDQPALKGMRTVTLVGTENSPAASGLVVISADGESGTLVVDNLATLTQDQAYQLWLIRDGQRDSGGTFSVSKRGYGYLWVKSPQALGSYQSFGITIEPDGGSPGPTGPKVLGGVN